MWAAVDRFPSSGRMFRDATLAADISFEGTAGDPRRKALACMILQTLDLPIRRTPMPPCTRWVDVAPVPRGEGRAPYEIQSALRSEAAAIENRGAMSPMSIAGADGVLHPAGGAFRLELAEPFYIGSGVCLANTRWWKAVFTNVDSPRHARALPSTRLSCSVVKR